MKRESERHDCAERVFTDRMGSHRCFRRGIIQENGKWYCRQHAPSAVAARQRARDEKDKRKWDILDKRAAVQRCERAVIEAARRWHEYQGRFVPLEDAVDALLAAEAELKALQEEEQK